MSTASTPRRNSGLNVQSGVDELDQRRAGLDAAEARGDLAVAGANPSGARVDLLQVPLLAGWQGLRAREGGEGASAGR
jgi:hypothetical protein